MPRRRRFRRSGSLTEHETPRRGSSRPRPDLIDLIGLPDPLDPLDPFNLL